MPKAEESLTISLDRVEAAELDELARHYGVFSREIAVKRAIKQSLFNIRAIFDENPGLLFERKRRNRDLQKRYRPRAEET